MPLVSYRYDSETALWRTDTDPWVCAAAPRCKGNSWRQVHDQIQAWLAPLRPINMLDAPLTPTSRICSWHGTAAGAAPVEVSPVPGPVVVIPDEIKPVIDPNESGDDSGSDGGDFSLFD